MTATIKGWNNGSVDRNVVTASYSEDRYITIAEEGNNAAYLVVAPTTIPAGTSLSFTLKTANYNISKTVSAPSDMTFTAGNLSVINLTIEEDNCAGINTSIDYSGEYLIAGKEGDKWYAAKKYTSGNYLSVSEIEFIGENIVETETISDHYMTIEKVADGTYKGMYTIVDAGGKYLSAVNGDENYLRAVDANAVSDNTYWSIEKDEEKGTYSIVASKSTDAEKNHMRFNYNSGTNSRVTCYGSTSTQPYLTLFSTSLVKPDTTPKITVTNTSYSALATDTSVEIPYTVKNITGKITATVADGATMSNVSTNVSDYMVTVSFAANEESAEKTATIVLSYDGAQSQEVVITQAAAGQTKQYYVKVTETPSDWSGIYLIVFDDNKAHATVSGKDFNATSGALTINEGKIEATSDLNAAAVTISKFGAGYSILLPNGTYLKVSSSNPISNATQVANYISFVANTTQKGCIRISGDANFNTSSYILYHQTVYFRCYTNKLSTSNYYLPDLYRLEDGGVTPEPDPTPDPDPETPEPDEPETPDTPTPSANSYTKYSGEIVEGDYIIVYDNAAMNTTEKSDRLQFATVSPSNDVISDPDASIVWHIAKSGDYWTIYNASANKYAASTGTRNQAQMLASGTDNKSLWTVTGTSTYEFVNKNNKANSVNSNLRKNGTYGFACYSTSTGGALTLYKNN